MGKGRSTGILALLCSLLLALAACGTDRPTRSPVVSETVKPGQKIGDYKVGSPYQIGGVWYYPKVDMEYDETGIASWYGPGFDGRQTANGEIFDQNALTAAHPTLPMPSVVRVTNLENGRALVVRINDRGPFKNGRIIDLSKRAAQLLGFERKGTAKVRVQIMEDESRQFAAAAQGKQLAKAAPEAVPIESVSAVSLDAPAGTAPQPAVVQDESPRQIAVDWPDGRVQQQQVRRSNIYIQAGSFLRRDNAARLSIRLSRLAQSQVQPVTVGDQHYFRVRLGPIASVNEADRLMNSLVASGHTDAKVVIQ